MSHRLGGDCWFPVGPEHHVEPFRHKLRLRHSCLSREHLELLGYLRRVVGENSDLALTALGNGALARWRLSSGPTAAGPQARSKVGSVGPYPRNPVVALHVRALQGIDSQVAHIN